MIRRNGRTSPVSWSEALDHVADRMNGLLAAGKSVGVLGSPRATNEENYLAGKLARAALQTNNIDFCLHSACRPLITGLEDVTGEYAGSIGLTDVESSDAILLLEDDLARTHPRAAFSVMKAIGRGARLITVGHVRTQMARLSSLYLEAAPGSESEAIHGLLAGVVHSGLEDRIWVAVHCDGYEGLQRDLAAVGTTEEAHQAAEWIGHAKRAAFLIAPTIGSDDRARRTAAAVATLAAITGHLDRPGSGLLLLLGRSNVRGACEMGIAPDRLPGYQPLYDARSQKCLQDLWGLKLPSSRGLEAESLLQSVSGLIVLADDPPSILPMRQQAMTAMEKMECLVLLDAFLTPTAAAAHVILPIASFAEQEGTQTNMEGRIQKLRAAIDPPGEARDGWKVLGELCTRLGAGASYASAADVLREIAQAVPRYAATGHPISDQEWGGTPEEATAGRKLMLQGATAIPAASAGHTHVLALDGVLDWAGDPMVSFSPTLSREHLSQRKLLPNGFVEMCKQDADEIGLRAGWPVKLTSISGEVVMPIQIRPDLKPGVLLVPYSFRDRVAGVIGIQNVTAVRVERT